MGRDAGAASHSNWDYVVVAAAVPFAKRESRRREELVAELKERLERAGVPPSRIEVGHPWELLAGEPLPTPPSNVSAFSWFDGLVLVLETSATAAIGVAIEKSTLALHRRVGRRLRGTVPRLTRELAEDRARHVVWMAYPAQLDSWFLDSSLSVIAEQVNPDGSWEFQMAYVKTGHGIREHDPGEWVYTVRIDAGGDQLAVGRVRRDRTPE